MLAFPEKWLMGSKGTHRATQSKTGFLPSFSVLWSQTGAVNFQGGKIIRYINYWYTGSKFTLFAREMDQGPWNSFPLPDAMRLSSFASRRCWRQTFASGGCAHSAGAIVASPVLSSWDTEQPAPTSASQVPLGDTSLWTVFLGSPVLGGKFPGSPSSTPSQQPLCHETQQPWSRSVLAGRALFLGCSISALA